MGTRDGLGVHDGNQRGGRRRQEGEGVRSACRRRLEITRYQSTS